MLRKVLFITIFTINNLTGYCDSLNLIWKNTDVAKNRNWGEADYPTWQAVGIGGYFYLQNANRQVVEVWNNTGKVDEIASGKGTNICKDESGNLIVRATSHTKAWGTNNRLTIINPITFTSKTIDIGTLSGAKGYLFGNATGDVMFGRGDMFILTQGSEHVNHIPFEAGTQLWIENTQYDFRSIVHPDIDLSSQRGKPLVSDNAMIKCAHESDGTVLSISNPYYNLTGDSNGQGNSIYKVKIANNQLIREGFYITPYHNGCSGFDIIKTDSLSLIIYPAGDTNSNGFAIAEIDAITDSPQTTHSDDNTLIYYKKEEPISNASLSNMVTNEIYTQSLNFETCNDGTFKIYQYVPNQFIALYSLNLNDSGSIISTKFSNFDPKLQVSKSLLTFDKPIEHTIYSITGHCVAKGNNCSETLSPGIYFIKLPYSIKKIVIP